jgi:phospholipid/cholesterol/gamma-HCH transport system ATP-binding protein
MEIMMTDQPVIEVKNLKTYIGNTKVHEDVNFTVGQGEIFGVVGGSGSGKTTILRTILGLQRPTSGTIKVFGQDITTASPEAMLAIQRRWGVCFQANALFSSLTLLENVAFPLKEHSTLDMKTIKELALLKIMLVGLPPEAALKYPSELSGGMQKRAAVARAIALDPELLFFDEPSAGLDPDSAASLDELILSLQETMGLTIFIITHDLDTLWTVTNRVAFLGQGKVLCIEEMAKLVENKDPLIHDFFGGPRGRTAKRIYE